MIYKNISINMAIFSNISEDVAKEFIDHRINIKKRLTQGAFDRAMATAVKCEKLGISAEDAVIMAIDKTWQGVTYEYVAAEISRRMSAMTQAATTPRLQQQESSRSTRDRSVLEDLTDRSWAN